MTTIKPLLSLPGLLATLDAALPAGEVITRPVAAAQGCVAAQHIHAPHEWPPAHMALAAGYAVMARETVGASVHTPVFLQQGLSPVCIGDRLPAAADVVLDHQAVSRIGGMMEITTQAAPGEQVRMAGHDVREGAVMIPAGTTVSAQHRLACDVLSIKSIDVWRCALAIKPHDDPARQWLSDQVRAWGCCVDDHATPAMVIDWMSDGAAQVALLPGAGIGVGLDHKPPVLHCPPRFDSAVALALAILLPVIAARTGRRVQTMPCILQRKLPSRIGMSELVLVKTDGIDAYPFGAGEVTLESLLQADAFAIIPAASEGYAAGETMSATLLSAPMIALDAP
ncbi:MAG: hypothetical protein ACRCTD_06935 [Beijerinckiaceae bacterium]